MTTLRLSRSPLLVALVLTVVACGGSARGQAPSFTLPTAPMSAADEARLPIPDVVGPGALGRYDAPAVIYGVWDPARGVALRAFGLADRAARTAASPDQSFRIASITKTFTATAVLLLVDDGKVRLEAPTARYVGTLVDRLPGGRTATVRGLLNMTSGFPDYVGLRDGPFATAALAPRRRWTAARLVRAAARYPSTRRGRFAYSNLNYVVLAELVARCSGMPFGTFVRRRILAPLGLRHTRVPGFKVTVPVALHGYMDASWEQDGAPAARTGDDVTTWATSFAGGTATGVSTLADLARWAASDFGNALLKPGTRAARLRAVPAGRLFRGSSYGLGLQVEQGWHFHVGEVLGWEALAMANPRTSQVVVVARNACCGSVFETYLTAREALPALAPVVDPVYRR